jgi:hypothetical protein
MRVEGVLRAHAYALDSVFTRGLANGLCFGEECRGPFRVGGEIRSYVSSASWRPGPGRSAEQRHRWPSRPMSAATGPAVGVPDDVAGGADDRWARPVHRAYPLLARWPSFLAAATASAAGAEVPARRATPNLGALVPDRVDSGYLRSVLLNDRRQGEGGAESWQKSLILSSWVVGRPVRSSQLGSPRIPLAGWLWWKRGARRPLRS